MIHHLKGLIVMGCILSMCHSSANGGNTHPGGGTTSGLPRRNQPQLPVQVRVVGGHPVSNHNDTQNREFVNLGTNNPLNAASASVSNNEEIAESYENLRLSAERGEAEAQYRLGMMYQVGNGVEQDAAIATEWLTLAADQGHGLAQYALGQMYSRCPTSTIPSSREGESGVQCRQGQISNSRGPVVQQPQVRGVSEVVGQRSVETGRSQGVRSRIYRGITLRPDESVMELDLNKLPASWHARWEIVRYAIGDDDKEYPIAQRITGGKVQQSQAKPASQGQLHNSDDRPGASRVPQITGRNLLYEQCDAVSIALLQRPGIVNAKILNNAAAATRNCRASGGNTGQIEDNLITAATQYAKRDPNFNLSLFIEQLKED